MVAMAGAPNLKRCAEQTRLLDILTEAAKAYAYEASELSKDMGKLQATADVLRREPWRSFDVKQSRPVKFT
jgi:hypothetical protein